MKKLLTSLLVFMYAPGQADENSGSGIRVGDALNMGTSLQPEMAKAKPGTFEPPLSKDNEAQISTAAPTPTEIANEGADAAGATDAGIVEETQSRETLVAGSEVAQETNGTQGTEGEVAGGTEEEKATKAAAAGSKTKK